METPEQVAAVNGGRPTERLLEGILTGVLVATEEHSNHTRTCPYHLECEDAR